VYFILVQQVRITSLDIAGCMIFHYSAISCGRFQIHCLLIVYLTFTVSLYTCLFMTFHISAQLQTRHSYRRNGRRFGEELEIFESGTTNALCFSHL